MSVTSVSQFDICTLRYKWQTSEYIQHQQSYLCVGEIVCNMPPSCQVPDLLVIDGSLWLYHG